MRFVSLFAGIGGIDLGLERAGHTCVGQVEIDPYCQKVLARHWPTTPRHSDVRTFKGTEFGPFDLLAGGYPCQPFSHAGSRNGEADPRHLWPEVHRIIRNVRPKFVLLENVPGHLSLGFGRVLGDLAESGYDAEWDCIPASAVGAPHQRDRVWIVAYPNGDGRGAEDAWAWGGFHDEHGQREEAQRERHQIEPRVGAHGAAVADTQGEPGDGRDHDAQQRMGTEPLPEPGNCRWPHALADADGMAGTTRSAREGQRRTVYQPGTFQRTVRRCSPLRDVWLSEPNVGRVVDGVPARAHRLRALGNAVVPQVAELIGRRLPA